MEDFLHERGRLCEKPFTHLYKALLPKKYLVSKQKVSKKRVTPVPGNRKKIGSSAKKNWQRMRQVWTLHISFAFWIYVSKPKVFYRSETLALCLWEFSWRNQRYGMFDLWKNIWFPNTTKSRLSPKQRECVSAADGKSRCWESRSFMKTRQWGVSSRITPPLTNENGG